MDCCARVMLAGTTCSMEQLNVLSPVDSTASRGLRLLRGCSAVRVGNTPKTWDSTQLKLKPDGQVMRVVETLESMESKREKATVYY